MTGLGNQNSVKGGKTTPGRLTWPKYHRHRMRTKSHHHLGMPSNHQKGGIHAYAMEAAPGKQGTTHGMYVSVPGGAMEATAATADRKLLVAVV